MEHSENQAFKIFVILEKKNDLLGSIWVAPHGEFCLGTSSYVMDVVSRMYIQLLLLPCILI